MIVCGSFKPAVKTITILNAEFGSRLIGNRIPVNGELFQGCSMILCRSLLYRALPERSHVTNNTNINNYYYNLRTDNYFKMSGFSIMETGGAPKRISAGQYTYSPEKPLDLPLTEASKKKAVLANDIRANAELLKALDRSMCQPVSTLPPVSARTVPVGDYRAYFRPLRLFRQERSKPEEIIQSGEKPGIYRETVRMAVIRKHNVFQAPKETRTPQTALFSVLVQQLRAAPFELEALTAMKVRLNAPGDVSVRCHSVLPNMPPTALPAAQTLLRAIQISGGVRSLTKTLRIAQTVSVTHMLRKVFLRHKMLTPQPVGISVFRQILPPMRILKTERLPFGIRIMGSEPEYGHTYELQTAKSIFVKRDVLRSKVNANAAKALISPRPMCTRILERNAQRVYWTQTVYIARHTCSGALKAETLTAFERQIAHLRLFALKHSFGRIAIPQTDKRQNAYTAFFVHGYGFLAAHKLFAAYTDSITSAIKYRNKISEIKFQNARKSQRRRPDSLRGGTDAAVWNYSRKDVPMFSCRSNIMQTLPLSAHLTDSAVKPQTQRAEMLASIRYAARLAETERASINYALLATTVDMTWLMEEALPLKLPLVRKYGEYGIAAEMYSVGTNRDSLKAFHKKPAGRFYERLSRKLYEKSHVTFDGKLYEKSHVTFNGKLYEKSHVTFDGKLYEKSHVTFNGKLYEKSHVTFDGKLYEKSHGAFNGNRYEKFYGTFYGRLYEKLYKKRYAGVLQKSNAATLSVSESENWKATRNYALVRAFIIARSFARYFGTHSVEEVKLSNKRGRFTSLGHTFGANHHAEYTHTRDRMGTHMIPVKSARFLLAAKGGFGEERYSVSVFPLNKPTNTFAYKSRRSLKRTSIVKGAGEAYEHVVGLSKPTIRSVLGYRVKEKLFAEQSRTHRAFALRLTAGKLVLKSLAARQAHGYSQMYSHYRTMGYSQMYGHHRMMGYSQTRGYYRLVNFTDVNNITTTPKYRKSERLFSYPVPTLPSFARTRRRHRLHSAQKYLPLLFLAFKCGSNTKTMQLSKIRAVYGYMNSRSERYIVSTLLLKNRIKPESRLNFYSRQEPVEVTVGIAKPFDIRQTEKLVPTYPVYMKNSAVSSALIRQAFGYILGRKWSGSVKTFKQADGKGAYIDFEESKSGAPKELINKSKKPAAEKAPDTPADSAGNGVHEYTYNSLRNEPGVFYEASAGRQEPLYPPSQTEREVRKLEVRLNEISEAVDAVNVNYIYESVYEKIERRLRNERRRYGL